MSKRTGKINIISKNQKEVITPKVEKEEELEEKPKKKVIKKITPKVEKEVEIDLEEKPKKKVIKKTTPKVEKDLEEKPKKKVIKKTTPKKDTNKVDYSYLRIPENKKIFELSSNDNNLKHEDKEYILKKIKQAHQILYEMENIEGENALNDIMNFIFLRLLHEISSSKQEEGKIDILNKEYYKDIYDIEDKKEIKKLDYILSLFDLKKLANEPLDNIRNLEGTDLIKKMGEILKTHPITKKIYIEENFIRAEKAATIQNLLKRCINDIDMKKMINNEDVIGDIYEFFINNYHKSGSKLGQYFTPRTMMKLILEYKHSNFSEILKNSKEYHVGDMCMGTGGWLVMFNNMFKEKYGKNILLLGGEVKPNTFQYGLMNLITTLGKMPYKLQRDNSLTKIDDDKLNLIISNPPFKTDFKFENIKSNYDKENKPKIEEVYILQDNNPPIQFLEMYLHKLKEGGKCIIVLPYGELFSGSSYRDARKYFLESTNIEEIILCPGGIFTHTGIKTCVLIFSKDKKGTKEITFSEINIECSSVTKITCVKKEDIEKEPNLSFYHRDYLEDELIGDLIKKMPQYEWNEIGTLFTLEKGKIQSSKVEEDEEGITFISGATTFKKIVKQNISYVSNGDNIFISHTGNGDKVPIKFYSGECNYSDLMSLLKINKEHINNKFIYYYLTYLKLHIEKNYQKGSCNLSLDIKNFNRMKIPILQIELQNKIVNDLEIIEKKKVLYDKMKELNEQGKHSFIETAIKLFSNKEDTQILLLKDVIHFLEKGKRKSSDGMEEGKYPLFYCSINNVLYLDEYDFEGESMTLNVTNGNGKCCVFYINGKYSVADSTLHFTTSDEEKYRCYYIYNYLKLIQKSISGLYRGTNQLSITKETFINKIKIPIPSIKNQDEIISVLKEMDMELDMLNNQINKIREQLTNLFMKQLESN
jgi:type I restriction-modification system DNA methylase subunit